MARNDIVLVDSLVNKLKDQIRNRDDSEVFELFCFDQVLKDFDLSYEELETGWTDGGDDGGVDGFFVFVDGHLITDTDLGFALKRNPEICLELFTVKRTDSFKLEPLNSLYTSISELLDLTKEAKEFSYPFRQEVLHQRHLLKHCIVSLADRRPRLNISVHYCCRGDTRLLADNLKSRVDLIRQVVAELFGDAFIEINFFGASELLEMARRQQSYSLRLKFLESYISREGANYVVLAALPEYFRFVTDEQGHLRRYLFDSNIRDYLGPVLINEDIRRTLSSNKNPNEEDFWWLNNGVTILATHANVVGKEMSLENVQIVNGLQTTETIHKFYSETASLDDTRAVLIKILLAADEQTRARIIKATNYQNTVDLSSLRGLDTIQRDIEHFFFDNGWYYDRRKNYYKNQGRPADRIVSIAYLAAAVRAIALRDPARSQRQRARSLRNDDEYRQVFSSDWDLEVYLASLEITHAVESVIQNRRRLTFTPPIALVHYIGFVYACDQLGKPNYTPQEVASLAGRPPSSLAIQQIREELRRASGAQRTKKYEGITLSRSFIEDFVRRRFHGSTADVMKDVREIAKRRGSQSEELSLADIANKLIEVQRLESPTDIIFDAYVLLKQASEILSGKHQFIGFKRSLVDAAVGRGVERALIDQELRTVFILRSKAIEMPDDIRIKDAEIFLRAAATIFQYLGVDPKI